MIEQKIMLSSIDDVKNFAAIAGTKKYDIDITSGRYIINAKSIMGIFSLDLTKPLTVVAHNEEDDDLLELISSYIYVEPEKEN